MAKKVETGGIVSPANLWGKPLPRVPNKPTATEEGKAARMLPDEKIDSDVDAELEEDEPTAAELAEEDSVEDEDEVSTVEATGGDEDEDAEEDDEFESEEGDDDDADVSDVADEGANSVDSAVDVDEVPVPAATKAGATPKVMKKMAEKKSISDHVRDEIADRKSAGESLRGVDIVNALAKRKIKVSPAQVSQLLKKAGVSQKARGGRKAVAVAATEPRSRSALKAKKVETRQQAPKIRATTGTTTELPWKQLNAAKAFIAACNGSFDEASDTLSMFQKIENVLHN
jgi:hypothetical protein